MNYDKTIQIFIQKKSHLRGSYTTFNSKTIGNQGVSVSFCIYSSRNSSTFSSGNGLDK